jgi:hypothetical protein
MAAPQNELDLLAIFHYVLAALSALFGLFPVIHVVLGVAMVTGRLDGGRGGPPQELFGWVFIAMGAALILAAFAYAALLVLAGSFLKSRRHWTYCLVMAAVSCAFFPFGTVLGVFTIVALSRPETKALFAVTAPPRPATPPAAG